MKHQDFNPCLASAFQGNRHIPVVLVLFMPWSSWGALDMEVSSVSRTRQCGLVNTEANVETGVLESSLGSSSY